MIQAWNTRHISDDMVERAAKAIANRRAKMYPDVQILPSYGNYIDDAKAALTVALKGE